MLAGMVDIKRDHIRLLDPGAGVGILTAATVSACLSEDASVRSISVHAYENEPLFIDMLHETLQLCARQCEGFGVPFSFQISPDDFITSAVDLINRMPKYGELFHPYTSEFNTVVMNPPYKKLSSQTLVRDMLRLAGIETSNLYTAFLWLAIRLLQPEGELISITPRSFCNGPYFRPFREAFLQEMSFRRIHIFNSRSDPFSDDEVLQESIIMRAKKSNRLQKVEITSSDGPYDDALTLNRVAHSKVVSQSDSQHFIHLAVDGIAQTVASQIMGLPATLNDLKINVSTGRVVDFRVDSHLCQHADTATVPLVYPRHFANGCVVWPGKVSKKPNAIIRNEDTEDLLVDRGFYTLCKRFSAKEEQRRVVAAVYNPETLLAAKVGFENHINYFHEHGRPLEKLLAMGLMVFLNSTLVDQYLRQFNGHTQVNATDLRSLRYPSREQIFEIGRNIDNVTPTQAEIDKLIEEIVMTGTGNDVNPIALLQKMAEAVDILRQLGMPAAQLNERSGLTLLALLNLAADAPWSKAESRAIGISPMMQFMEEQYGKKYAPNTRETIRKQTVHQLVDAGLVLRNLDQMDRPVNSPGTVYQIAPEALQVISSFSGRQWKRRLNSYLRGAETLREMQEQTRRMKMLPVTLPDGTELQLSAGGQNPLIKRVIEDFCPRFTPDGDCLYIGDASDKWALFLEERFVELNIPVPDKHGKMPDVVIHYAQQDWLVLIEAVTSHGPVNHKRHQELRELFSGGQAGLVYVTAFESRAAMRKYLSEIAWETEVWCEDDPTHMIHFNGERFLGPY